MVLQSINMKPRIIRTASFIASVLLLGFLLYYSTNQFRHQLAKPSMRAVTADELLNAFIRNETTATEQYVDKTIQVWGRVSNIGLLKNNQVQIILAGTRQRSVLCTINPERLFGIIDSIEIGGEILIEGKCIGFLNDVYLKNCTVLNQPKRND